MTDLAWVRAGPSPGRFVAGVAPTGRGLFETMRAVPDSAGGARLPLWEPHVERLGRSAPVVGLELPEDVDELRFRAVELCARNGVVDGVVRLTLVAGTGGPAVWLTTRPRVELGRPLRLRLATARRAPGDPTAAVKSTDRAFYDAAQAEVRALGADEAVIASPDGRVLETANGNLFCRVGGVVCTPILDGTFLPGVARAVLLEALAAGGTPVLERAVHLDELAAADGLWVANAVHGPRSAAFGPIAPVAEGPLASAWQRRIR